jgi:5-formyltetrahydrofolate cyclo-ligase
VTKAELRREMRTRLAALGAARDEKSRALVAALARQPGLLDNGYIALFSPIPTEPDVESLWQIIPRRFCYPRVTQGQMEFVEVEKLGDLTASSWHPHIREHGQAEARVVPPKDIAAIIVPGLAFTKSGQRLGRGGGYYDRYLAALPPTTHKIGVCFALQIVDSLPIEAHDQKMDVVITENGLAAVMKPARNPGKPRKVSPRDRK